MIVVLGSINLDLAFAVPHLPAAGETVLGPQAAASPGGKGANQALAAARDGGRVAMCGVVGRDAFAGPALALLIAEGVDCAGIARTDRATGLAAIAVDPAGRNQILVASGANLDVRAAQLDGMQLRGATVVLQMEIPPAEVAAAIRTAKARGARVILNLAPAGPLPEEALRAVDILVANEGEIATLADGSPVEAARAVRDRLGVTVVVTLGAEGAVAWDARGGGWRIGALAVRAVDTTGAGDTFVGVLAAALDRDETMPVALRRASAAAGLACAAPGAQAGMPRQAAIDAVIETLEPARALV